MDALKIRTESLPVRCEICHQADRFDPATNQCARCSGVAVGQAAGSVAVAAEEKAPTITDMELGAVLGLGLGAIFGSVCGAVLLSSESILLGICYGLFAISWLWVIQGFAVGLLLGKSATITDEAAVSAISRAVATAPTFREDNPWRARLQALKRTSKSALLGALASLPLGFVVSRALPLDPSLTLFLWLMWGMVHGITTGWLCHRRSDRREGDYV